MSRGSDTPSFRWHLSNPLRERERITLEDAIEVYKIWSEESGAYVETDDQRLTHTGFEKLLSDVREKEIEISPITLSRLVERFVSIESHILNEEEVRNLVKRYPGVAFDGDWTALKIDTVDDSVDVILKSEEEKTETEIDPELDPESETNLSEEEVEEGKTEQETGDDREIRESEGEGREEPGSKVDELMLVEIAFKSNSKKALGTLLSEKERLAYITEARADEISMCLVVLESDEFFAKACKKSGVKLLELGPKSLIERVEKSAEWGNLRGLTLSP